MTSTNEKPDPLTARGIKLQGEYFADCNLLVDVIAKDKEAYEELKQERDALAAQVERLQKIPYTKTRAEFMESWGVDGMPADKKRVVIAAWDRAEWFFNQQVDSLKAHWQAEVVDRCEKEVTASFSVLLKPYIAGVFAVIHQHLQEKF